jgi:hypothetical protein
MFIYHCSFFLSLNRLTGKGSKPHQFPISTNAITAQVIANRNFKNINKMHSRFVKKETTSLWSSSGMDGFLSQPFTKEEMLAAVLNLKAGKAQGPDNIPAEFLMNCGHIAIEWLCISTPNLAQGNSYSYT